MSPAWMCASTPPYVAELARGSRAREDVLSSHGLDEDAWQALDGEWQDRMSAALNGRATGFRRSLRVTGEAFRAAQAKEPVVSFEVFLAAARRAKWRRRTRRSPGSVSPSTSWCARTPTGRGR